MSEVTIALARDDDVRLVGRLRQIDETGLRLALELSEQESAWVARDGPKAIGWALARISDDERFVGDVFVSASYRGQRIGSRLLDAALAESGDAARRVSIDGGDAVGLALALSRGLNPFATVVRIAGAIPRENALLSMAAGDYRFEVDSVDPVRHAYALDALDRETRATTRSSDHQRFAREGAGLAFYKDGEFVGYAYLWPDGRIGPAAASAPTYLSQMFAYALVMMQRTFGASWCSALVPGENVRVARSALRAGLRIDQTFAIAGDAGMGDLTRYVAFHPLSF
jgi:GNAT superfamily N-acetyltransferase